MLYKMKKGSRSFNFKFLLVLLIFGFAVSKTFSQNDQPFNSNTSPLPAPTGAVNDYVGVIDAETKQRLEQKLKQLKETNNPPIEIAVAVVDTTGDRPIFDYSLAVARGWGIGSKDLDNPSALLLIAINDRKYFTQVSRDLEDELPDGLVGSIQREYLVPEFKKSNYAKGIEDTINAYIAAIEKRTSGTTAVTSPTPRQKTTSSKGFVGIPTGCICLLIIGFLVLISIIKSFFGGGRGGRGGGGGGFGSALPWIIGSAIANSASSGSSWGGGGSSSGGGGSDWGGFGGGGDFGGGGAGGDW